MPSYPLSEMEFIQAQHNGWFNPAATYRDYLAMIEDREEMKREAEEQARREGDELGSPRIELTPEDEAALDRAWAIVAAEQAAVEDPPFLPAKVA
jgi:hypothetical protein